MIASNSKDLDFAIIAEELEPAEHAATDLLERIVAKLQDSPKAWHAEP